MYFTLVNNKKDLMKTLILSTAILIISVGETIAQSGNHKANEIVSFLEGKWHNYTYTITDGRPVNKADYEETMTIKNDTSLIITAHNYKEGEDLTREMILAINENDVVMQQGNFKATGKREGNAYYLKGYSGDKEFRFRLYTMGDKYIFHNEVWREGKIKMMNMSYLVRD